MEGAEITMERLEYVVVHGVAIKPGKPVIIGTIGNKPVIGLPGYPLSALTVLREVLLPIEPAVLPRAQVAEYIYEPEPSAVLGELLPGMWR
jgi:molybdopterin biosynthesis enzyme